MFSKTLLARSGFLRLPQVHSRSLSSLRLFQPALPSYPGRRQFAAAPALREKRADQASPTPSGTCYIANIPYKVTAEQLKEAFSEFGKIESVKLMTSDTGLSRGVGFVRFESVTDAIRFIEANHADPIFVLDRQLFTDHAQKVMNVPAEPSDTLVVLDIRGELEVEVRTMFAGYADRILEVRFNKKEGSPLRKAFVQFRDIDIATEAMEAFKNQNESSRVAYAKHRLPPTRSYSLTSRLSQYREK